jgi:predicted amidohydrolase
MRAPAAPCRDARLPVWVPRFAASIKLAMCVCMCFGTDASQESETLSPGTWLSSFEAPFGKIGLGICYDIVSHFLLLCGVNCPPMLSIIDGADVPSDSLRWPWLLLVKVCCNDAWSPMPSPMREAERARLRLRSSALVSTDRVD